MSHLTAPKISYAQALKPRLPQEPEKSSTAISYATMAKKTESLSLQDKKESTAASTNTKAISLIKNVHNDDVHALAKISDGYFISGSKDGAIKKWNIQGELISSFYDPSHIDYTKWITSVEVTYDTTILAGTRDGYVGKWTKEGDHLGVICSPTSLVKGISSKVRNWERVNCIAHDPSAVFKDIIFIGRPTLFSLHNTATGDEICRIKTHEQDWVYCIRPLSERAIAVVSATELELWSPMRENLSQWQKTEVLVSAKKDERETERVRPFISSLTPLEGNEHLLAMSVFNNSQEGDISVKVLDMESKKIAWQTPGHLGRTWKIENLSQNIFASCGDEGTIKIWDIRKKGFLANLQDNTERKARVSCLLKMGDSTLISASCPDDLRASADKAQFCIRDIRKYKA